MRLSQSTFHQLPGSVERFGYLRHAQAPGIVHLGVGAFHRAHQAWYTDRALDSGDHGWAIVGVSLRSADAAARLNPQDCLYSLTLRDGASSTTRVIGALRQVIPAATPAGWSQAIDAIASPETRIVTLTVTEKGYALAAGRSEGGAPSVQPIYSLLAAGLARRRSAGLAGITLVSCDNLRGNGDLLARNLGSSLAATDEALATWFADQCPCPSTMVDRIVPAPGAADLRAAADTLGLEDQAALVAEPFSQWILEDRFAQGRPAWERVGAQFTSDVRPYETAKLRMLNGAHSALAYLGLERGHEFVDQAIADPAIAPLVETIIRREATESFTPAQGQDLGAYADLILARFANPALRHRLDQIATDGSQKISGRWLASIADRRRRGFASPALLAVLGSWVRYVRGDLHKVDDPLAGHFATLWNSEGEGGIVAALFSKRGYFADALTAEEQCKLTGSLRLGPKTSPKNIINSNI